MKLVLVSGQLMDLFVKNKVKGLFKGSPFLYQPMLFKEEVEEAFIAEFLAEYPFC